MIERRDVVMPYVYHEDHMTRHLRANQPSMEDPEACYQALLGNTPEREYLLNKKNARLMARDGPFTDPYRDADELEGLYEGRTAFVFCPGPSMSLAPLEKFQNHVTICVNSAGFKIRHALFWAVFESNYALWAKDQKVPKGRRWIMTARVAARWRGMWKKTEITHRAWIPKFEERRNMPHRTSAVGTMGALVSAWWLGCARAYLIGCDLSRPGGRPYVEGVPHSAEGAKNPFDEQVVALAQFSLPGFKVLNVSPHSRTKLPFEWATVEDMVAAAEREAPPEAPPEELVAWRAVASSR